jgi:hypothetical protein
MTISSRPAWRRIRSEAAPALPGGKAWRSAFGEQFAGDQAERDGFFSIEAKPARGVAPKIDLRVPWPSTSLVWALASKTRPVGASKMVAAPGIWRKTSANRASALSAAYAVHSIACVAHRMTAHTPV